MDAFGDEIFDFTAAVAPAPNANRPASVAPAAASYVINRRGERVPVRFDKITERNRELCENPYYGRVLRDVDLDAVTAEVATKFRSGMTTRELDSETARVCEVRSADGADYEALATRIYVSDLHRETAPTLAEAVAALPRVYSEEFRGIVRRGGAAIEARIDYARDFRFGFFGYQTMSLSYLRRPLGAKPARTTLDEPLHSDAPHLRIERPQHAYMRIALVLAMSRADGNGDKVGDAEFAAGLAAAGFLYDALSTHRVSHATPTMINAGAAKQQLSSCFQLATGDDLAELYKTVADGALISKHAGGISVALGGVRADGALIAGTGGESSGLRHLLGLWNQMQKHVNQGGTRRGAIAAYVPIDHADVFTAMDVARPRPSARFQKDPANNIKYALWVSDRFMRVLGAEMAATAADKTADPGIGDWHLFSPDTAPDLQWTYGAAYDVLYERYVAEGRAVRVVKASVLIREVFETWAMAGVPYVLFKDKFNNKSNLAHVAPIVSSNLCCEIGIPAWSAHDAAAAGRFHPDNAEGGEYGVCNLAAICLESFVRAEAATGKDGPAARIDWRGLFAAARLECRMLNRVIDTTWYPTKECERSNQRHRPIGIGMMGLANVFARLGLDYGEDAAVEVARGIAAVIYAGAAYESCRLARVDGPHRSWNGSPESRGLLQPDLWRQQGELRDGWEERVEAATCGFLGPAFWARLRSAETGVAGGSRNCFKTAYMPTATTSNIVGQNEGFEPFTANIYTRKTLAGDFYVVNRHMVSDLRALGLWGPAMRSRIIAADGSIAGIAEIPAEIRRRYRTARELEPRDMLRVAAVMAPFVDQSMSLNAYFKAPELDSILSWLFAGWKAGLKTGMYYCHTAAAAGGNTGVVAAPAATTPAASVPAAAADDGPVCRRGEDCTSCGV